ncbi:MAG: hypothetical protein J6586_10030, partial [Snodgrassella sp.]|nr:hypothetical protein [Snodgrassella sp.]
TVKTRSNEDTKLRSTTKTLKQTLEKDQKEEKVPKTKEPIQTSQTTHRSLKPLLLGCNHGS